MPYGVTVWGNDGGSGAPARAFTPPHLHQRMPVAQLQLKPAAAEILRSDAQVRIVFSGRRFGKTRLGLTALIEECLSKPGSKVF